MTEQTEWTGSSRAVAQFCIEIDGRFTIHAPITPPSGVQFCPVIRWTDEAGTVRRFKLFAGVGEMLPLPTYIGEAIISPAALEIWNTPDYNPTTLAADWSIQLGLLENPASPTDETGTIYIVDSCIPAFPYFDYGMLDTLFTECPACE